MTRSGLSIRIEGSKALRAQEKLALGLLINENMTAQQIIDCLMSNPYDLSFEEAFKALQKLKKMGLIRLAGFVENNRNFSADTYLTFVEDWVLRLA